MKHLILVITSSILALGNLSADRVLGTKGVIDEFTQVEEAFKNQKISPEFRKKMLEKNLVNAVRASMIKRYYADFQTRIKDLSPANLRFEQEKGTFNYFINFKDYYFVYTFAVDPEIHLQSPVDQRLYVKLPDLELKKASGDSGSKSEPISPPTAKDGK